MELYRGCWYSGDSATVGGEPPGSGAAQTALSSAPPALSFEVALPWPSGGRRMPRRTAVAPDRRGAERRRLLPPLPSPLSHRGGRPAAVVPLLLRR